MTRYQPTWTREAIIAAFKEWAVEHGHAPSRRDWAKGGPGRPTAETVRQRFGTFDAGRRAAGLTFLRCNQAGEWSRKDILDGLFRWRFLYGRLPRAIDWRVSVDGFPTEWWVRKHFGTWNAAILAAGYEPAQPRLSDKGYRARIAWVTKRREAA